MLNFKAPAVVCTAFFAVFTAPAAQAQTQLSQPSRPLVLALGGEPETGFDPLLGWGSYGNPLFHSTLLQRAADLSSRGDLALSQQLSDDRLTWVVKLREDARFSDGSALTAEDVAFTFTRAKTAGGEVDLQVLESATATGPFEVTFRLREPRITFVDSFYTLGIVPAAGYGADYARNPVGSGPYKLVSWSEGEQLILERNPYYYGEGSPFSPLTFLFTGVDAGIAAARAGVAHVAMAPAPLADAVPPGFRALSVPTVDSRGISLPHLPRSLREGREIGHDVTADPAIRKAINLALDRALIAEVALSGHGRPAASSVDGLPWGNSAPGVPADPVAAAALLDAAGWLAGPDGRRAKAGQPAAFALHYPASDPTRQALAEVVAELLRPLGLEVTPKGGSWAEIRRVMAAEPVVFGFGSHSPWQLYSLFASELGGVNYMNPTFYANREVDALFAKAQQAPSLEASYPFWRAAEQHFGDAGDQAWAWLVNIDHVYFVNSCLDTGALAIEPHGHGWPLTAGLADWRWSCE